MAKKTGGNKGAESAPVNLEQSNALDEKGSHVFPDATPAPSGSSETMSEPDAESTKGEAEAAPSGSGESTKGRKKGGGKSKATPAKNVNERRVIAPKGGKGAKGKKGAEKEAPAESTEAAPAKKRGRPRKDGLPAGTELAQVDPLSEEESKRLSEIEAEVDKGMDSFIHISSLLLEISEKRLYRASHKSFTAYVEARFNIKGRLGWYQVAAAGVNRALANQGVTNLPRTEFQARPLSSLRNEPEKLAQAWEVANEIATSEGVQEPTADHTARAVARVTGKPEPTPATPAPSPSPAPTPVDSAKSNGTIPANTEVSTTEVSDNGNGEGDDIPAESIPDIEMRDDRWLAQFPLDSRLKGLPLKRFKAAALAYRWLASARVTFIRTVLTPIIKEAKRDSGVKELDPYLHRLRYGLTAPAPDKWVACDVCNATGQVPTIGGCTSCHKAGFIVPVR